jgi:hypothetical protein
LSQSTKGTSTGSVPRAVATPLRPIPINTLNRSERRRRAGSAGGLIAWQNPIRKSLAQPDRNAATEEATSDFPLLFLPLVGDTIAAALSNSLSKSSAQQHLSIFRNDNNMLFAISSHMR